MALEIIENLYETKTALTQKINAADKIQQSPCVVLKVFSDRCRKGLEQVQAEKTAKQAEWRQCGSLNFIKSLDHRSFFFKEA